MRNGRNAKGKDVTASAEKVTRERESLASAKKYSTKVAR
jgi:hypothetical protein